MSLDGFNIVVSPLLKGCKRAVKSGDTIVVSPAMWALMQDASPDELERLLKAIPCIDIGELRLRQLRA